MAAKNSGKQRKTAGVLLFFSASDRGKPRISAANAAALAVNFLEEQRKQRTTLSPGLIPMAQNVKYSSCPDLI